MRISLKKICLSLTIVIIITLPFSFPQPVKSNNHWLDSTWQYRLPILVDNTQNALPLKNYLLTLNLSPTNFDFAKANSSGYDFRFTQDDGLTLLDHDLEYYNPYIQARVNVLIPYAPAKQKFLIYLYYGAKISVSNLEKNLSPSTAIALPDHLLIFDEGEYGAPSEWEIKAETPTAEIIQRSNIWSYDSPKMSGTYALLKNKKFTLGELNLNLMSEDDDGLGVIFNSQDKDNYYRLSWYRSASKVVTTLPGSRLDAGLFLQKKQNGVWTPLASSPQIYKTNEWYSLKISVDSQTILVFINDKKIFEVKDDSIRGSWLGLYSWANRGSHFRNLINLANQENPALYLPVSYTLTPEENYSDYLKNQNLTSPSLILTLSENQNLNPAQIYFTYNPKPLITGLVTYGLKVKLYVDDQFTADITPKEGKKSGTANWFYQFTNELTPGEHTIFTTPYELKTDRHLSSSPKIKFIVQGSVISQSQLKTNAKPMAAPTLLSLAENKNVNMKQVYTLSQREPLITGLAPYGWPVRIYIDDVSAGNAAVQDGELTGTANFYFKTPITPGRHTLIAVTYNPETNEESRSPQEITFEVK